MAEMLFVMPRIVSLLVRKSNFNSCNGIFRFSVSTLVAILTLAVVSVVVSVINVLAAARNRFN